MLSSNAHGHLGDLIRIFQNDPTLVEAYKMVALDALNRMADV